MPEQSQKCFLIGTNDPEVDCMNCGAGEGGTGQIIQEAQTMDNNKQETRATCQGEPGTQITNIS